MSSILKASSAIEVGAQNTISDAPVMGDAYVTLSGVDWSTFEGIANRTRGGRVCYNDGELEIMSPGLRHEDFGDHLRLFVEVFCEALGIEAMALGSTTWKAPKVLKGVEADAAFYLSSEKVESADAKLTAVEEVKDITGFPAPDLVIEVDMRQARTDRSAVYAAIGAVEVWEFDGEQAWIQRLNPDGIHESISRSGWFPCEPADIVEAIKNAPRSLMARRRWLREFVDRLIAEWRANGNEVR